MPYSTSDSRGALLSKQSVNEVDIKQACGDEVLALVEDRFALTDAGTRDVKGKGKTQVWTVSPQY